MALASGRWKDLRRKSAEGAPSQQRWLEARVVRGIGHSRSAALALESFIAGQRRPFPQLKSLLASFSYTHALAAVMSIGFVLRVWNLTLIGFNSDEAVYAGQAGSIAGDSSLTPFFPIVRAHPLLVHVLLSFPFRWFGTSDLAGRLVIALFGVATIFVVYLLGELIYNRRVGLIAAVFMALMPYHVVVSRQVLLDGPTAFFASLSMYLILKFVVSRRPMWLYGGAAVLGLTFLAKETSIILIGSIYSFFALSPAIKVRIRDMTLAVACFFITVLPFPITLVMAGRTGTGKQYLIWQLFRRSNHEWTFYPTVALPAMGLLVLLAAGVGLWMFRKEFSWRETFLICWIAVPLLFFQLWPVKGFQYLLIFAPAVVLLAGRAFDRWLSHGMVNRWGRGEASWIEPAAIGLVCLSLLIPTIQRLGPPESLELLAGSGGVPGGREAGAWIKANTPEDSKIMTIGPSMVNLLQYYGERKAYGLSVSINPLHRNPAYEALANPDFHIRNNEIQYVVWDTFSATRSPYYSHRILQFADRYSGRVAYVYRAVVRTQEGKRVRKPLIVVYEVHP